MEFEAERLETLLVDLDPTRSLAQAGFRGPAPASALRGLPADLAALWGWRDGQDRARSLVRTSRHHAPRPCLIDQRFGITRRLRFQGRLLPVGEARALAVPGFMPVFEHKERADGTRTYVGRCDDGVLRHSRNIDDGDALRGEPPGPRAEGGRGDLASWLASLEAARRQMYMDGLRPFERAQRWVLALTGPLGSAWLAAWDTFGMGSWHEHGRAVVLVLRRDWGIVDAATARATLTALLGATERPAWNLGRAVAVAGWAYRAGYLGLDEAWGSAVAAARALQPLHRGWFSYAEAYFGAHDGELSRAREHAAGDAADLARLDEAFDLDARKRLEELHAWPCSPWNLLAWQTPLPDDLPPPAEPEVPDVVPVEDADELARALFESRPGSILRLAAGRYRGSFQTRERGLVIEPERGAEVVIEGEGDLPALMVTEPTIVRGVTIVPSDCGILQDGTFLRVEGCRFERGAGDALRLVAPPGDDDAGDDDADGADDDGEGGGEAAGGRFGRGDNVQQIVGARFVDLQGGATWSACGVTHVEGATIEGASGNALTAIDGATLVVRDTTIARVGKSGLRLAKGARGELARVAVRDVAASGVILSGGEHELSEVVVERARAGIFIDGGAVADIVGSRLAGCAAANVEVVAAGRVVFSGCRLEGGQWAGAWLHPGHHTAFLHCHIGGSRLACVFVDGGTDVTIAGSELGPSREGGLVFLANGADVRAAGLVGRGAVAAAIEVAGSALVVPRGLTLSDVGGAALVAHSGGRVRARGVRLARVGGDVAVWITQGARAELVDVAIEGVGPGQGGSSGPSRKGGRGIVVGEGSTALVSGLVARDLGGRGADAPDHERGLALLVGERSRLALAGALALGAEDDAAQAITGGLFAGRDVTLIGQSGYAVLASEAEVYLERATLGGRALSLKQGARATLVATPVPRGALHRAPDATIEELPERVEPAAGRADRVSADRAALEAWGVAPGGAIVAELTGLVAERLGVTDVRLAPDPGAKGGVTLTGPEASRRALVAAMGRVMAHPGALGCALAELVGRAAAAPEGQED
ncbi:MAG: DUF1266 domain-containing protein [Deltaproteobacteria bacterium]|nr:DUF1266 domain-containing protein [Deltaproteobacteria bacterium]